MYLLRARSLMTALVCLQAGAAVAGPAPRQEPPLQRGVWPAVFYRPLGREYFGRTPPVPPVLGSPARDMIRDWAPAADMRGVLVYGSGRSLVLRAAGESGFPSSVAHYPMGGQELCYPQFSPNGRYLTLHHDLNIGLTADREESDSIGATVWDTQSGNAAEHDAITWLPRPGLWDEYRTWTPDSRIHGNRDVVTGKFVAKYKWLCHPYPWRPAGVTPRGTALAVGLVPVTFRRRPRRPHIMRYNVYETARDGREHIVLKNAENVAAAPNDKWLAFTHSPDFVPQPYPGGSDDQRDYSPPRRLQYVGLYDRQFKRRKPLCAVTTREGEALRFVWRADSRQVVLLAVRRWEAEGPESGWGARLRTALRVVKIISAVGDAFVDGWRIGSAPQARVETIDITPMLLAHNGRYLFLRCRDAVNHPTNYMTLRAIDLKTQRMLVVARFEGDKKDGSCMGFDWLDLSEPLPAEGPSKKAGEAPLRHGAWPVPRPGQIVVAATGEEMPGDPWCLAAAPSGVRGIVAYRWRAALTMRAIGCSLRLDEKQTARVHYGVVGDTAWYPQFSPNGRYIVLHGDRQTAWNAEKDEITVMQVRLWDSVTGEVGRYAGQVSYMDGDRLSNYYRPWSPGSEYFDDKSPDGRKPPAVIPWEKWQDSYGYGGITKAGTVLYWRPVADRQHPGGGVEQNVYEWTHAGREKLVLAQAREACQSPDGRLLTFVHSASNVPYDQPNSMDHDQAPSRAARYVGLYENVLGTPVAY